MLQGNKDDRKIETLVLGRETMLIARKQVVSLYVDRECRQWIVRDPDGNFWTIPCVDSPWDHREPYHPSEASDLEPIPGHYKDMLGLPF